MYGKETWMRTGTKRGTDEQEEGGRGGKDSGKRRGKPRQERRGWKGRTQGKLV